MRVIKVGNIVNLSHLADVPLQISLYGRIQGNKFSRYYIAQEIDNLNIYI